MEAERILKELRDRDFVKDGEEAQRELRKAEALLERVKSMTSDPLRMDGLNERLKRLNDLMTESVNTIQSQVREPSVSALQHLVSGKRSADEIKYALSKSSENLQWSNETLNEASGLLNKARDALIDASVNFEVLVVFLNF